MVWGCRGARIGGPAAPPARADPLPVLQVDAGSPSAPLPNTPRRSPPLLALLAAAAAALVLLSARAPRAPRGAPADCAPASADARLAFYRDLGGFTRPIRTTSGPCQALHDRGALLAFGFHSAAASSFFRAAAAADPSAAAPLCALAHALGPGANRAPLEEDEARPAFPAFRPADAGAAAAAAAACARNAEAALRERPEDAMAVREAALARAAEARFAPGTERGAARAAADAAFSAALEAIGDADSLAMAAEAALVGRQWDYREPDGETFLPHAARAWRLAQSALALDPDHPLALHLVVHLAETGSPGRSFSPGAPTASAAAGEEAATRLSTPGPWSAARVGHLLHMPAHVFARTGWWADAVRAGRAALAADRAAAGACVEAYAVEHNAASLVAAANANGDREAAAEAAAFLADAPRVAGPALLYANGTADVATLTYHRIQFADWGALAREEAPGPAARTQCLGGGREAATVAHALGVALAAAARAGPGASEVALAPVRAAVAALDAAAAAVPPEPRTHPGPPPGLYACEHVSMASVAVAVGRARLAALEGRAGDAVAALAAAVATQAALPYFEPPRHPWHVAPCLGWLQLTAAGDAGGAEATFRADLAARPANPRSLLGLAMARSAQGDAAGAADAKKGAERRWRGREPLASPCPAFG